jgi:hypothetical protein
VAASARAEIFAETAARKGLPEAIIEKDFWVCWVLKQLFWMCCNFEKVASASLGGSTGRQLR